MKFFVTSLMAIVPAALAGYFFMSVPAYGLMAAAPAEASYSCTPEGFTLVKNAEGWLLEGSLDMPTPGYTYDMTRREDGTFVFSFKAPDGMVIQVIDSLKISQQFSNDDIGEKLHIAIENNGVAWGETRIVCKTEIK